MDDNTCIHCTGLGFIPRFHINCNGEPEDHVSSTGEVTYIQHYPCGNCDTTGDSRGLSSGKRMKSLPNVLKNAYEMWYLK